jgi:phytoene desaturase
VEPDLEKKLEKFLKQTGRLFHDTENIIVKQNFNSLFIMPNAISKVPIETWPEDVLLHVDGTKQAFSSFEVKVILSLVGLLPGINPV